MDFSSKKEDSIFHFHGCIQKENLVIVSINPSNKYNFINKKLVKKINVQAKNIKESQIFHMDIQIYEYLNLFMDKYVLSCPNFNCLICMEWILFLVILGWNIWEQ